MKSDFTRLKLKILLQILLVSMITVIVGAFVLFFVIDDALQAPFAEGFVRIAERLLNISYDSAARIYRKIFIENKSIFLAAGFIFLLMIFLFIAMSSYTRYFNKISEGIDALVEESDNPIDLPPELSFMENKLNTVKNTLEKRKSAALESERRKNDLVVYLAHDIKTPLTSVIGYLSLLSEAPDMPLEQRLKYTDITLKKANRLEQLINEFFEITRFNLQSIVLEKEDINLTLMLQQMADEFYPVLSPQNKEAVVNTDEDIQIFADSDKLARVFNNILKNAAAYSYENSTIEISAKQTEKITIIRFKNKGKMIPADKLDSIFEKFYRVDSSRSSNTGGTGLGLAIAKEIVNLHGGDITASSNEEFTQFTVTLPGNNH
ncbi:MAG TPA: vancomycin resistance histidine kinase VanS [Ruminiclostridium sp.]|nr:vancomycin resistance histidine kinase VanS [Ruminiclostridium sp.]